MFQSQFNNRIIIPLNLSYQLVEMVKSKLPNAIISGTEWFFLLGYANIFASFLSTFTKSERIMRERALGYVLDLVQIREQFKKNRTGTPAKQG